MEKGDQTAWEESGNGKEVDGRVENAGQGVSETKFPGCTISQTTSPRTIGYFPLF